MLSHDAQNAMLQGYRLAMEELKNRILVLNVLLDGKRGLPNPAIQEFGFLQLRILCELIALSCLTAHGDIPATREKRLREEYNPTKILKRLEHLHSDFYPRPVQVCDVGPNQKHIAWVQNGSLTKAELIRLYGRASEIVHRGTVETLLDAARWPHDTTELFSWGQKIVSLLQHHAIRH